MLLCPYLVAGDDAMPVSVNDTYRWKAGDPVLQWPTQIHKIGHGPDSRMQ